MRSRCFSGRWHLFAVAVLVLLGAGSAQADTLLKDEQTTFKTVTGQVGGVGPRFIAVEYKHEKGIAHELALPLDEKAKLQNLKALKDLKLGDTVTVEYRETTFRDEAEKDVLKSKRVATKVTFVKAAPPQPAETAADTEQP